MPGADDKVLFTIKLDSKGLSKEFQALIKEMGRLRTEVANLAKQSTKGQTDQQKAIKDTVAAIRNQVTEAVQAERSKQSEINKTTDAIKKQSKTAAEEGKKAQGIWGRFSKGLGIGSGASGMFQRPEGGWAQWAGQKVGSAPRAVANTALSAGTGLLGFMMGGIQGAYGQYLQAGQAMAPLAGMGSSMKQFRGALRASGGVGGVNLGFGPAATYQQAAGVGRATGDIANVYRAQQLALAGGGMDVGEATGIMGGLRSAGYKFGKRDTGVRELEKLISSGMATGLERARLPDYLQNVAAIAREQGTRVTGQVDLRGATMGLGMISKIPGLNDPGRAMDMFKKLEQGFMAPGAGEAGQALVMQSLGFGKPGGTTSFYEAQKAQQKGFTGRAGAENMLKMLDEVTTQYGVKGVGGKAPEMQEANIVLSQLSGLTLDQVEQLQEVNNSGKTQEEKLAALEEIQKKMEPIEKQALKATQDGFSGVAKRLAGIEAKNVAIGAKTAWLVEGMQDLQRDLLSFLVKEIVPLLKETVKYLRQMIGGFKASFPGLFEKGVSEVEKQMEREKRSEAAHGAQVAWQKKWGGRKLTKEEMAKAAAEKGEITGAQQEALREMGTYGSTESRFESGWEFAQSLQKAAISFDPREKWKALKEAKTAAGAFIRGGERKVEERPSNEQLYENQKKVRDEAARIMELRQERSGVAIPGLPAAGKKRRTAKDVAREAVAEYEGKSPVEVEAEAPTGNPKAPAKVKVTVETPPGGGPPPVKGSQPRQQQ